MHTVGLRSQTHHKRLNVLGFLHCQAGHVHSFPITEAVTAQHLVDSVETLLPKLVLPTVVVLDNATLHRSKLVQGKRSEWKKKGVRLLFLPAYCPHLNRIETLWRHIKYRWLEPADYADFTTLTQAVTNVLLKYGNKYLLSFE